MFDCFVCLMWTGGIVPHGILDQLFTAARTMMREQKARLPLKNEHMEGVVCTGFRSVCYAGMAGILFDAVVEWDDEKQKVRYLVRDVDLEDAGERAWVRSPVPIPPPPFFTFRGASPN